MKSFKAILAQRAYLVGVLVVLQALPCGCITTTPPNDTPIPAGLEQQRDGFTGSVDFSTNKTSTFELNGSTDNLGRYTARGEVTFRDGDKAGTLLGEGVAVFDTADGKLVAAVKWPVEAEAGGQRAGNIEFHWRDSVTLQDGTVVDSDGKFADPDNRPPGLVVIAIIAVLIGLLLPAVQ